MTAQSARPGKRSGARLAATQALFQLEFSGGAAGPVVEEFLRHRFTKPGDDGMIAAPADRALFDDIVNGVAGRRAEIDAAILPALPAGWAIDRLDPVLRACLRAAIYELLARLEIPARVVIDEYVRVVSGFASGGEPGLLNGMLDRIARSIRPVEFTSDHASRQTAR
jgi:N utilization substance protein B